MKALNERQKEYAKEILEQYYENVDREVDEIAKQAYYNCEDENEWEEQVEHFAGMEDIPETITRFATAE